MSRAIQRWVFLILLSTVGLWYYFHIQNLNPAWSRLFPSSSTRHIDWTRIPQKHPVQTLKPLPSGPSKALPKIQAHSFGQEDELQRGNRLERKKAVRDVFLRSWNAYKENAWGHDEFSPKTKAFKDHFGGWGATLVDNLDSLLILGLDDEFRDAIVAVQKIDYSVSHMERLNVFETTIRHLGGLLGAHELADGKDGGVLLKKAKELGDMLYHAFDTDNRMPLARWAWQSSAVGNPEPNQAYVLAAELGSMSLEFTRLSQITGDPKWYDAVQRISDVLDREQSQTKLPGLWPVAFNAQTQKFSTSQDDDLFTFGGRADSMYEYIPKEYMMLGGQVDQYKRMYESFMEVAQKKLFFKPMNAGNLDILISGSSVIASNGQPTLRPEGQHLSCFVGGLLAISSKIFARAEDLATAKKLVDGCIWAYSSTATGIMPEVFTLIPPLEGNPKNKWDKKRWLAAINDLYPANKDEVKDPEGRAAQIAKAHKLPEGVTSIPDRRYMLRPEAIESIFVLYRVTGDRKYQDVAWKMFQSITQATITDLSYASIPDVTQPNGDRTDNSESFWMAETLKYFYLIFSEPSLVSLDDYVFNTEAHPLKIPKPV